jgi:hypothetical protein
MELKNRISQNCTQKHGINQQLIVNSKASLQLWIKFLNKKTDPDVAMRFSFIQIAPA